MERYRYTLDTLAIEKEAAGREGDQEFGFARITLRADVPDNVPESHTAARPFPGPPHESRPDVPDNLMYRIIGHYPIVRRPVVVPGNRTAASVTGSRERWLVDGDVGPGRSDDDVAVNGDGPYRFG